MICSTLSEGDNPGDSVISYYAGVQLIDRGRVNVDDVASEKGVSSNSLEAALLQGETTSFSPDLKLKIIRWLHDSAHILRCGSAIPPDNEVAKIDDTEAGKVCGPFVLDDTKFADLSAPDAAVNSLPPCRTKSKFSILKDNEASSRASKIPAALTEDVKEDIIYDKLSNHNLHSCCESLELSEKILEDSNPTGSLPSLDLSPGLKGLLCTLGLQVGLILFTLLSSQGTHKSSDKYEAFLSTAPSVVLGFLSFYLILFALWPIWGILTILFLIALLMSFMVMLSYLIRGPPDTESHCDAQHLP